MNENRHVSSGICTVSKWDLLAKQIVSHSLDLISGEQVYVDVMGDAGDLVEPLLKQILATGAWPFLRLRSANYTKWLIREGSEEQIRSWCQKELDIMQDCEAYIGIRSEDNFYEFSDLPRIQYERYKNLYLLPIQHRVADLKRWVLLQAPSHGSAQLARMSLDRYEDIYFRSCAMDYVGMAKFARPLINRLEKANQIHLLAKGTDLRFSVRGIPTFLCDGRYNLPDGELFTAPVSGSAEGNVTFNVPTFFLGECYEAGHKFTFKNGKVTEVKGTESERIRHILAQDAGAGQIGEFGIGLNPHIRQPMNHILFDEKMCGSIHLAMGQAFPMASNGNESEIHWDFVLNMSKDAGGGELYFDEELIMKDGRFVPKELDLLNGG